MSDVFCCIRVRGRCRAVLGRGVFHDKMGEEAGKGVDRGAPSRTGPPYCVLCSCSTEQPSGERIIAYQCAISRIASESKKCKVFTPIWFNAKRSVRRWVRGMGVFLHFGGSMFDSMKWENRRLMRHLATFSASGQVAKQHGRIVSQARSNEESLIKISGRTFRAHHLDQSLPYA